MENIKREANRFQQYVFSSLVNRDKKKYNKFILLIRLFKYFPGQWRKGKFLELYYAIMRYFDDIADGDHRVPDGYSSASSYLEARSAILQGSLIEKREDVDELLSYAFSLAQSFDGVFIEETIMILKTLLFDAQRRLGEIPKAISRKQLRYHNYNLDIFGTIRICLVLFGENKEEYRRLAPLGVAVRTHYDVRDLHTDINAGLINIPLEDLDDIGVGVDQLNDVSNTKIEPYFVRETNRALKLLKAHRRILKTTNFSWITRFVLWFIYERNAHIFLRG